MTNEGNPAQALAERIVAGGEATPEEMRRLVETAAKDDLFAAAHQVTEAFKAEVFDFCAILNARCGTCSENCKWCAQSAHWKTACDTWGLKSVEALCAAIRRIRAETSLACCGSFGLVGEADLAKLKAAGLARVHCNLETAPSRFARLCTTHTVAEKVATLKAAKRLGLEVCCGGILGMGETPGELVEFAFALKEIAPDSIPVNVLHPIPGTPLGERPFLSEEEILTGIAVLRLVNPRTPLRFAGGRRDMSDATAARALYVGVSAGIAGPLLTTPGADFADDRQLALEAGYAVARAGR